MSRFFEARDGARWGRADAALSTRSCCLGLEGEYPVRTAGKDEQASSVTRAGGGGRQETKEARSSLL